MGDMSHEMSAAVSDSGSTSHSYLLRIWCTKDDGGAEVWHALLRRADETKPISFPDLEALFTFLANHYLASPVPAPSAERTENERFGK